MSHSATASYLRFPHVAGDLVALAAADDVWVAPVTGGRAWRISQDRSPVRSPRLSPDASQLAWVSHLDGHPEVRLVDLDGGPSRRLTWWGAQHTQLLGWHTDAGEPRLLVASEAGQAQTRHVVVRSVGTDGSVRPLPYGPVWGLALRRDGAVALSTPGSRPPAWWKRYRGGTAPRLWLDPRGSGEWQQLLADEEASLVDPMWVADELLFVSDRAARLPGAPHEQANLWRWPRPGSGEPELLTHADAALGYVRDATTDGRRVVWHSRGRLWLLEDLDGAPRPIEVTVPGSRPVPFAARPTEQLTDLVPDHTGDASLLLWRGTAHWMGHREGPARAVASTPGVRVREPALLGRDGRAVLVTDEGGEDSLRVIALDGTEPARDLCAGELGRVLHLAADPAGERVATVSHDGVVGLVDVGSGEWRRLATSSYGEAGRPVFSPDGRYLVWSEPIDPEGQTARLVVHDTAAGTDPVELTAGRFHDHDPVFTADGRYLVFLSARTFDPSYDDHEFGLAFTGSTRPWVLPLAATQPLPFGPGVDGWPLQSTDREPAKGPADEPEPVVCPDLDLEDAEQRIAVLPVPAGVLEGLRATADGVAWVRRSTESGVLGSRRSGVGDDPAPDQLEVWSFPARRSQVLAEKVDGFQVSGDGRRLLVRTRDGKRDEVTARPADRPVEPDAPELVRLDLDRLHLQVEPVAEWLQMFDENARLMRDHYWRADLDGVDWDEVTARWRPLVPALASHDDLVDLLWETVGELNTSHAYVMPAAPLGEESRRLGLLGAELSPAGEGWRIDRVLPGESSDPGARSPLRAAGVDARPGDLVVEVAGRPVDPVLGVGPALVGTADQPVELTLSRDGVRRRVVVVPLGSEEGLRYQDWVASRRAYVTERSGGRLGYLHVPDMMGNGWAQLHRDLRRAAGAEGLVADVRYNRGGHTSQLVVARLASGVVGWVTGRHRQGRSRYPAAAPRGPVVLVANEYSGSDGDIVNAAAQALGVGPVVGLRTWGGVVGIDGRFLLVDGTGVTQPRYSYWLQGPGWGVENHGVDPDLEVRPTPGDFFGTADLQLDRAIAEALDRLSEQPAVSPPELPPARVTP